jgi:hypothetical protein
MRSGGTVTARPEPETVSPGVMPEGDMPRAVRSRSPPTPDLPREETGLTSALPFKGADADTGGALRGRSASPPLAERPLDSMSASGTVLQVPGRSARPGLKPSAARGDMKACVNWGLRCCCVSPPADAAPGPAAAAPDDQSTEGPRPGDPPEKARRREEVGRSGR